MTRVTANYPVKIGDVLIPKGEVGRLATLEEAQAKVPGIEVRTGSPFLSVVFRDLDPCLVLRKQVTINPA